MTLRKDLMVLILVYGIGGIILLIPDNDLQMIGARMLLVAILGLAAFIGLIITGGYSGLISLFRSFSGYLKDFLPENFRHLISGFWRWLIRFEHVYEYFEWRDVVDPHSFAIPAALLAGAVFADKYEVMVLFYLPVALLTAFYFIAEGEIKWWTFIALGAAIINHGYRHGADFDSPVYLLFKHWCVFHLVRYGWWFRVPAVLFYIVTQHFVNHYDPQMGLAENMNLFIIYWVIALYAMRYRYGYMLTIFIFLVDLDSSLPALFTQNNSITLAESIITTLPYFIPPLLLACKKEISGFYKIILAVAVVFIWLGKY